ncbi:MAG: right-handed parallel beta-helix repeat-containing protein [Bacteroidales bacterium]|nr:right-handed parallel beta-helix repeat-containing protein [Bacteroidales bacterium]
MIKRVLIAISLLIVAAYSTAQILIQDSTFTESLNIYGHTWDSAIIKNCTFTNTILSDGIRIADADNVIIDSCIFYNIEGNGIRLHPIGVSDGIIIKNCRFDSIYGNGILADEQHINTEILNNTFNWIGLDSTGASIGQPHHGIYFSGNDFLISSNRIQNIYNNYGNCISVRSNGIVSKNVLSNATKNGITYFSDHPNLGNKLLIENNIVYNCQRGIRISDGGEPYVDSSVVRFNTVISNDYMCVSIGPDLNMSIEIYGNILVRTDGSPNHIWAESPVSQTHNVFSDEDIGFVNYLNNDYHITEQSIAYNFATGLLDFPLTDFENDLRNVNRLDAGADQFYLSTSILLNNETQFKIYPNPTNGKIIIDTQNQPITCVKIYDMIGNLKHEAFSNEFSISTLSDGFYIIIIQTNKSKLVSKIVKQ